MGASTRWSLVGDAERVGFGLYRCACGTEREVRHDNVKRGQSLSCGCAKTDMLRGRNRRRAVLGDLAPDTERAWAAGFWDGEGCTSAHTRPGQVLMSIQQAGPDPEATVRRFHAAVSGLGRIYGPYAARGDQRSVTYRWQAAAFEEVQQVLVLLWPYLSPVKREQARRVFTMQAARRVA